MKQEYWLQRWELSQTGFHQQEINTHLQAFWPQLALPAESRVLVPLCGKSRDLLWLRAQGHRVLGVEISPLAVRAFFTEHGLEPRIEPRGAFESWTVEGLEILVGDFFNLGAVDVADCIGVYDRASLVALPPPMRETYAQQLMRILPVGAVVLLVTTEYPQQEMTGPPFSVQSEEVERLYHARFSVEEVFALDVLTENPAFRDRGVSRLWERVFHLIP